MKIKRSWIILFATAVLIAITCALQATAASLSLAVRCPTAAELAQMEAVPNTGIRLKSLDYAWQSATGIEAKTFQGQLDEKIQYIEDKAPKDGGKFLIFEDISEGETLNTTGIRYMYANSNVYQEMADVSEWVFLASSEYTFSKLANQEISYERWVFAVAEKSTLNLSVSYDLEEGEMAVWLVSPDGEIAYQNDPAAEFTEDLKLDIETGLWSVVLVNYYDADYQLSGLKNIQGTVMSNS